APPHRGAVPRELEHVSCTYQGGAATRHDAPVQRGPAGLDRAPDPVARLLLLRDGVPADMDHRDGAANSGQPLAALLAFILRFEVNRIRRQSRCYQPVVEAHPIAELEPDLVGTRVAYIDHTGGRDAVEGARNELAKPRIPRRRRGDPSQLGASHHRPRLLPN